MDTEGPDDELRRRQSGVVSRRQLVELGAQPHEIRRMLRRRELTVVHPGIYVDHTGPLSWEQRAWAAVLVHWPAALTRESVLADPPSEPIHVAIGHHRTVRPVDDVRTHRTVDLDQRVRWNLSPPKMRVEHAVIEVAAGKRDVVARFRVLADAVQSRRTTVEAIGAALRARSGVAHRAELLELLADLEAGACSVLERAYLLLERRHGLGSATASRRQQPDQVRGGRIYRDVDHPGLGVVVELDGRAFHDTAAARDDDASRDLETVVTSGSLTVRLTWALVVRDGCRTAAHLATLMGRRGWTGSLTRCAECPDPQDGSPDV